MPTRGMPGGWHASGASLHLDAGPPGGARPSSLSHHSLTLQTIRCGFANLVRYVPLD